MSIDTTAPPDQAYIVRSQVGTVHRAAFKDGTMTGTACGIVPDRLTYPHWFDRIGLVTCRTAACLGRKPAVLTEPAPADLTDAERDLLKLAELLVHEARRRGWCTEYEHFVRHANAQLFKPRLMRRADMMITDGACFICGQRHPS